MAKVKEVSRSVEDVKIFKYVYGNPVPGIYIDKNRIIRKMENGEERCGASDKNYSVIYRNSAGEACLDQIAYPGKAYSIYEMLGAKSDYMKSIPLSELVPGDIVISVADYDVLEECVILTSSSAYGLARARVLHTTMKHSDYFRLNGPITHVITIGSLVRRDNIIYYIMDDR